MRLFHRNRKDDRMAGSRCPVRKQRRRGLLVEPLEDRTLRTMLFTPQNGAETVTDKGGDKLGQVSWGLPLYTIYWGSWWTTNSDGQKLQTKLQNSLNPIFWDSAYLDGLNQYGVPYRAGVPSSGTVEVNDTSNPSTGFTHDDVGNVVSNAIDNLGLPEEDDKPNGGLYVVFTPPGIRSDAPTANGYHNYTTDYDFPFDIDTWHYAWVGNFGTGDTQLSTMTETMSHEVAEAMTDPNLDAVIVNGTSEIADLDARKYTAFVNGYEVKSYWSQTDGAFAIYDGNSQSVTVNNGALTVNGDQSGSNTKDTVTVDLNPVGGVQVTLNGELFSFSAGQVNQVTINSGADVDTINIHSTASGIPVVVNAGPGNDTINVGNGDLSQLNGKVTVNGQGVGDSDQVIFNDKTASYSGTYTVTSSNVSRTSFSGVTSSGIEKMTLNAAPGANTITVMNTTSAIPVTINAGGGNTIQLGSGDLSKLPGGVTVTGQGGTDRVFVNDQSVASSNNYTITDSIVGRVSFGGLTYSGIQSLTLNADPGGNTINVTGTASGIPVTINAGGNNNTINVGNGDLSRLAGAVSVNDQGNGDRVNINDQSASSSNAYTITSSTVSRGFFGGLTYGKIVGLILNAESGNNTISVVSTAPGASVRLNGGAGNDTYKFDADNTLGSVTIDESGGGNDALDFSPTTTRAVAVNLGSSLAQVVNAGLSLTLLQNNTIENVDGGAQGDTITGNLLNNVLNGGGGDDMIDGSGGNNTLVGGAGNDTLTGGPGNDTYPFDTDSFLGRDTIIESGGVDTLDFSATTTRAVAVNLSNAAAQVVNAGLALTLSAGDTIENVIGGTLGDSINGNNLDNVLTGGDGNDTMFGQDGDDMLDGGANDDILSGGANDDTFIGGMGNDLQIGGADNDTFEFDTDNPLDSDTIDETGGGIDTLDFSSTTTRTVNVDLGYVGPQAVNGRLTLSLLAGNLIENVIGGAMGDTIAGTILDNVLTGGGGNDTLVARDGNDTLEGGAGDDTLNGGANDDTYLFDTDNALGRDTINESLGGIDTLDFSATSTRSVAVNLGTAAAQVVNAGLVLTLSAGNTIENATGGDQSDTIIGNALANYLRGRDGNDILVGNAGMDTLVGNNGRDLMIGGQDADTLDGGNDDDLEIGGATAYDANVAALDAILAEWTSARPYADRVNNLLNGGGLSGGNYLRATPAGRTVFDDGAIDTLTGGAGLDWFFQGNPDVITDRNTGGPETVS